MQRKHLLLASGVALLCALAAGYTWVGLHSFAAYRIANADYAAPCGDAITWNPPSNIYTGLYPNQPSLVNVRYRSQVSQTLRLSVSVPQLTEERSVEVIAGPTFQEQSMKPPLLGGAVLDALVGPRQREGQILLRVQAGGNTLCDTSVPVTLYSRQVMHWYDPVTGDNSPYLAGWVTPRAGVIRDLIHDAGDRLRQSQQSYPDTLTMHGYIGGASAADVRGQVNALFDTLQFVRHVHYAGDNLPYNRDATQVIQLPRDILSSPKPSGVCVETTVLLASAVEGVGMQPYIVIVPGHAFLGVALGADPSASIEYWETSDLKTDGVTGSQANADGNGEYADAQSHGTVQRVLDIVAERAQGIQPME